MENGSVKERLISYLSYRKIGQKKFALECGLSAGFVNSIVRSIQPDTMAKIQDKHPDLNPGWILTGEGTMLKSDSAVGALLQVYRENYRDNDIILEAKTNLKKIKDQATLNTVPLLPISAQAGTLNDFIVSVKNRDAEKIISPIKGADYAITVSGDSMSPEYPNGSQILIKKINENSFIEWGRVYVLDTTNGLVVKIINECSDNSDCLVCTSINSDQNRYAPFRVQKSDIIGMYRVMLCMSIK